MIIFALDSTMGDDDEEKKLWLCRSFSHNLPLASIGGKWMTQSVAELALPRNFPHKRTIGGSSSGRSESEIP